MSDWFADIGPQVRMDLRILARNPAGLAFQFLIAVFVGVGPLFSGYLEAALEEEPTETVVKTCPDPAPPLGAEGTWPSWMGTPDPEATVRLKIERGEDAFLLSLHGGTPDERGTAKRCLQGPLRQARLEHLRSLGVERPDRLVTVTAETPIAAIEAAESRFSWVGMVFALMALTLGSSVPLDLIPRRRASGFYEALRATGVPMAAMLLSILVTVAATMAITLGVAGAVWIFSAPGWRVTEVLLAMGHSWTLGLVLAMVTMRVVLFAPGVQEALFRWFAVLALLGAAVGVAFAALRVHPALAALVPLGGNALGAFGHLGAWALIGNGVSLLVAAGLVWHSGHALDHEEDSAAGIDPGLLRRARGEYLPEVLVLGAFASAAALLATAAGLGVNVYVTALFAFLTMMLLPALLAPTVLGLPRKELLQLHAPTPSPLAAGTLIALGMVGVGPVVLSLIASALPASSFADAMLEAMSENNTHSPDAIAAGQLPGICEEFLFRGAILGLLLQNKRFATANTLQAFLFAIAHAVAVRLPWTFAFGLLLGWILKRSGSLWVCIWIHALHNTLAVLLGVLAPELAGPWLALPGVVLLAAGVYWIHRLPGRTP